MAELMYDPEFGAQILNETTVPNSDVFMSLQETAPELASMVKWSFDTRLPSSGRHGNLFERDRYLTPANIFQQMRVAQDAAHSDDVVSGIVEGTEALAFNKMSLDCEDEDEDDIWNQIGEELDLESRLREMWREDFIVSQFYCAIYWGKRDYKVRGKSAAGVQRKKTFNNLTVPLGVSMLDPLKIVPVGNILFNQEKLAYIADNNGEYDIIRGVLEGEKSKDPIIAQLMLEPYEPDPVERRMLSEDGMSPDRLFLLNPQNVFRYASTRSQYKRFADVRMTSVFEILDMKAQLRAMDRAHLIGGTNFIILVKKGSDMHPGKPAEIAALQAQWRTMARVPVIVGDQRLSIEIVTPKLDMTLNPEKYNGLDARLTARLYQMFMTGNFAAGAKSDDSVKLAKVVARGLESRRHMIRNAVEKHILRPTYAFNDQFTTMPELRFHPKRIALDFDPTFATFLLDLRDRGDLSRESILEEVDFDQLTEWRRRKNEKSKFDDVFETTVPYSDPKAAPNPAKHAGSPTSGPPAKVGSPTTTTDPKSAGRRLGGNKGGGGAAPGTGQGQAPKNALKKSK